jgi:hypothetical protein
MNATYGQADQCPHLGVNGLTARSYDDRSGLQLVAQLRFLRLARKSNTLRPVICEIIDVTAESKKLLKTALVG